MILKHLLRTIVDALKPKTADTGESASLMAYFSKHHQKHGDIGKWEHYFPIYERYFAPYRGRPINLLEIGVFRGGSLGMWKGYFGPEINIFAIDINPGCRKYESETTKIFIGDQKDRQFLRDCLRQMPPLDIVIDDGSHKSDCQIASFEEIYPTVADGGLYLVEDTHVNYWEMAHGMPDSESFIGFAKERVDELHAWHWDVNLYARYAKPREERSGAVDVPEFTRCTQSVSFYDSIVVFEKRRIIEPRHWAAPLQIISAKVP